MKITSIEYIPIDEKIEEIKITRRNFLSRSYIYLKGTERYKRIGKILSAMEDLNKLSISFSNEIGNIRHLIVYVGY